MQSQYSLCCSRWSISPHLRYNIWKGTELLVWSKLPWVWGLFWGEEGWWCFLTEADGEVADRTKWLCASEVSFVSKHQTSLKSKHLSLHAHNFPRVYEHSRGHALIDERTRETLRKKVWNYLNVWLAMEEQTLVSRFAVHRRRKTPTLGITSVIFRIFLQVTTGLEASQPLTFALVTQVTRWVWEREEKEKCLA